MKKMINSDITILGGGASGIIAAISAAYNLKDSNKPYNITILEKNNQIGKKILMTGNGKCNLTNTKISPKNYNLSSRSFIEDILNKYPSEFIINLFNNFGLLTRMDSTGRVYPYSNQASSVLDVLINELSKLNVNIICNFDTISIKKEKNKFYIESSDLIVSSNKLIISCGGKSAPTSTLCTDAYKHLKSFSHTISPLLPALVPIKTNSGYEKNLKGIRSQSKINVIADENLIHTEYGEIQFTDSGLSGICIFQISYLIGEFLKFHTINKTPVKKVFISIDFMPEFSTSDIINLLRNIIKNSPGNTINNLLIGLLNKKLGQVILNKSKIYDLSKKYHELSDKQLKNISQTIKNFTFVPIELFPFKNSQVTSGGAILKEFNPLTLESKKVSGLYACGEILDVNGDCGGYNLHWAWVSGFIAGKSASNLFIKTKGVKK